MVFDIFRELAAHDGFLTVDTCHGLSHNAIKEYTKTCFVLFVY